MLLKTTIITASALLAVASGLSCKNSLGCPANQCCAYSNTSLTSGTGTIFTCEVKAQLTRNSPVKCMTALDTVQTLCKGQVICTRNNTVSCMS